MKSFIDEFMDNLKDEWGAEKLAKMREELMDADCTDEEWAEYCFSFESPF